MTGKTKRPEHNDLPGTPWDIGVDKLVKGKGLSIEKARDVIAFHWLRRGDTRAYSAFVRYGHRPSPTVSRYLGFMMNPSEGSEKTVPYELKIGQRGRRGRRQNPELELRDKLIHELVVKKKSEGRTQEQAIDFVDDMFPGDQWHTIEKAYKKQAKRARGK